MSDDGDQLPPLNDADLLRRAAERVLDRPGWLGHALWRHAHMERLGTVAAAAASLREGPGPAGEELSRLMLCRTPAGVAFIRQATEVADAFGLDRARLISMLRQVEHEGAGGGGAAHLLAARRDDEGEGGDDA